MTNKKFLKYDVRKCISLDCEHKVAFSETSISFKRMKIRTNQTHHDKVQDLFSPMIPIFRLTLKNSQRYDHSKKSSKRCGVFFVHNYIYIPNQKKMFPLENMCFLFEHNFVIPWVWVENLISLESWDYKLFNGVVCFLLFSRNF